MCNTLHTVIVGKIKYAASLERCSEKKYAQFHSHKLIHVCIYDEKKYAQFHSHKLVHVMMMFCRPCLFSTVYVQCLLVVVSSA